eukprot:5833033-Amphidinium_carterae.1
MAVLACSARLVIVCSAEREGASCGDPSPLSMAGQSPVGGRDVVFTSPLCIAVVHELGPRAALSCPRSLRVSS